MSLESGRGGSYAKGDRVLYAELDGGWKFALVVEVDVSIDPVGYTIEVEGVERGTEGTRQGGH